MLSWKDLKVLRSVGGQPILSWNRPSLLTWSKAFVRLVKASEPCPAAGLGSEQTVPTLPVNSSVPGRGEANPVGADGNAEASGMA